MTPDEYVNEYFEGWLQPNDEPDNIEASKSDIFEAAKQYAMQVAITFKEWQDENLEGDKWENYDGHDTWINPHTREVKSTTELYELYLKQK